MIGNALLALGIVLTTASQLRLPAVPLGFGELCLVLWLGLASLRLLTTGRISNPDAVLRIVAFWACFAFAMSVGTCLALFLNELEPTTMLHDASALLLMVAFTCLIVATITADREVRQAQWLLIAFWNIALVVQLALGWGIVSLPSVSPWYWDRFRGWAENPNQVALYCAVFTPLSLSLSSIVQGFWSHRRIVYVPVVLHCRAVDQERYVSCRHGGCNRLLSLAASANLVDRAGTQILDAICSRALRCHHRGSSIAFTGAVCDSDR